ncbi:uncharacterized protein BDZ99DRAFT_562508, partial [Mytilinidion resinicola]
IVYGPTSIVHAPAPITSKERKGISQLPLARALRWRKDRKLVRTACTLHRTTPILLLLPSHKHLRLHPLHPFTLNPLHHAPQYLLTRNLHLGTQSLRLTRIHPILLHRRKQLLILPPRPPPFHHHPYRRRLQQRPHHPPQPLRHLMRPSLEKRPYRPARAPAIRKHNLHLRQRRHIMQRPIPRRHRHLISLPLPAIQIPTHRQIKIPPLLHPTLLRQIKQ